MRRGWKIAGVVMGAAVLGGFLIVLVHAIRISKKRSPILLVGAVIQQNSDPRNELPLAGVKIYATNGTAATETTSDASGFFRFVAPAGSMLGKSVILVFRHPGFHPLVLNRTVSREIYIAQMASQRDVVKAASEIPVSNVRVRYSKDTTTIVNVGSAARTFQVVNRGNVPCHGKRPCSPDGNWKASTGSLSLDAGEGNRFSDVRVSCIGGPCPFTTIQPIHYSRHGRDLNVRAFDWSDTTVFLLQAEVVRAQVSAVVRDTYPVIFGDTMNFTVPSGAEGVSVEADLNGELIVFPLGPANLLSWADCSAGVSGDQSKVYRCELGPGYRFR